MISALPLEAPFPAETFRNATAETVLAYADANIRAHEAYHEAIAPWSCRLYGTTVSGGKVVWAQDDFWVASGASPYLDAGNTTRLVIPKTGRWLFHGGIGFAATGSVKLTATEAAGATDFGGAGVAADVCVDGARVLQQNDYVEMVLITGTLAARFNGPWLTATRIGPTL